MRPFPSNEGAPLGGGGLREYDSTTLPRNFMPTIEAAIPAPRPGGLGPAIPFGIGPRKLAPGQRVDQWGNIAHDPTMGLSARAQNSRGGLTTVGMPAMPVSMVGADGMTSRDRTGGISGYSADQWAKRKAADPFGQGMNLFSGPPAGPKGNTSYAANGMDAYGRPIQGMAEGGEVDGPGGPKDDKVPAMLSDGEFVMPAEAVKFFGLQKLEQMRMKAKEGLAEMEAQGAGSKEPGVPVQNFAQGGPVQKIKNPYSDDPALYAQVQRAANDARLAQMGITDTGMGSKVLSNKYGTGFAVRSPAGAPGVFNANGMQATATPGKGLMMVPDVVQSGPWAMPGMLDDPAARRAEIAARSKELMQSAPFARGIDQMTDTLKARFTPKGPGFITVPQRTGLPQGPAVGNPFWERDAAAQANIEPDPASLTRPEGVRRTDWRRFLRSRQGLAAQLGAQEDESHRAEQQRRATTFQDIPGSPDYQINALGNVVRKGREQQPVGMSMEQAEKMGLEIASVDEQGRAKWKPKSEKAARVKIYDEMGTIKDWPAGYKVPTGWTKAEPEDAAAPTAAAPPADAKSALAALMARRAKS